MNIEDLKQKALDAIENPDDSVVEVHFEMAANPAAVLELIRQRDELMAALKDSLRISFLVSCQAGVVGRCECGDCITKRIDLIIAKAEG
jgi:hypothetical protein